MRRLYWKDGYSSIQKYVNGVELTCLQIWWYAKQGAHLKKKTSILFFLKYPKLKTTVQS